MAPTSTKRRRGEDEVRRPKKKKKIRNFKKQKEYHSSSDDDDDDEDTPARQTALAVRNATGANSTPRLQPAAVSQDKLSPQTKPQASIAVLTDHEALNNEREDQFKEDEIEAEVEDDDEQMDDVQINTALNMSAHDSSEEDAAESDDGVAVDGLDDISVEEQEDDDLIDEYGSDDPSEQSGVARKKRNDPAAFATSISKILTTKLTTQKRNDPILSRSKTAEEANKAIADGKLDTKAKAAIRGERRLLLERGRVRDVLGLETTGVETGAIVEQEKKLKKTAQRGVVKLFNAVRAAQVKAEETERNVRQEGMVGMHKREERINEMSKEGFLDLISRGGKAPVET